MQKIVQVANIPIGGGHPLVIIAGPCAIESYDITYRTAALLKHVTQQLQLPFVFKAAYDKANRTAIGSYRGPGVAEGLRILSKIKAELDVPLLSDVHEIDQVEKAASVLDVLQIPAFLCRQTDFILEVGRCGRPVNIKKGQFLAPWDISQVIEKLHSVGCRQILLTERGAMFGYNNLVVDFRSIPIMQATGYPVIFDATHSVQLPGGAGTHSGGQRQYAPILARAAVAAGADAVFMEVHPDPDRALCDGANSLPAAGVEKLLAELKAIRSALGKEA
jgi:2-dehydro-3-deoxyphosphooctonate aldolase (KDO 8-P synthase)